MGLLDRLTGRKALLDEIETLRRENRRLRRERSTMGGMRSITGLQDKVIQLDDKLAIEYVNSTLVTELKLVKEELVGQPLARVDSFPWGPGLLEQLVQRALNGEEEVVAERSCTDPVTNREKFYKVKVSCLNHKPQILIENITNLRSLELIFARYVSPKVIEKMKQLPEQDFFRADRVELTVLFGDLRGFTQVSQEMKPEQVRLTINDYLEAMMNVADKYEAYVDKVVADEVMVLFGAPIPDADHAGKSLEVALEMQQAQAKLCGLWQKQNRPELHLGIGINTGEMVIGNVGSNKRVDYTVLGHNVNVAARLCNSAKPREILLAESTWSAIRQGDNPVKDRVQFTESGAIQAKGIREPVKVVAVHPLG